MEGKGEKYSELYVVGNEGPSNNVRGQVDSLNMEQESYPELQILQAVTFLEDAQAYRSIHHKIDRRALRILKIYNSRPICWLRNFIIFLLHLLAFFEYPSSLTLTSDLRFATHRYHFPCGALQLVELICLLLLSVDVCSKIYLIGRINSLRNKWIISYAVVLIISIIDWIVSMSFFCIEVIRIRRYLRPFFILQNGYLMKKMLKCLRRTLPEVASVLLLLGLHLYMFTIFGMLIFPNPISNSTAVQESSKSVKDEGSKYFHSLYKSIMNMLVLLTTANNPDVTMPAYKVNRFYQIYFVVFLVIGLYCFMNMLTAVIYNQFRGYFLNSMQSSLFRRRVGIRAAYEVLARTPVMFRCNTFGLVRSTVSVEVVRKIVSQCNMKKLKKNSILEALATIETDDILASQFIELFAILDKDLEKTQSPPIVSSRWVILRPLQLILLHHYFNYFCILVAFINVIIISVELSVSVDNSLGSRNSPLGLINLVFISFYIVEHLVKLWSQGFNVYLSSKSNLFDGFLTVVLVVMEIFYLFKFGLPIVSGMDKKLSGNLVELSYDILRSINIIITIRLLRIIPYFKTISIVASTLLDLIRNLKSFAGILVSMYYFFAILGIQIFSGKITYDAPSNATNSTNISLNSQPYKCGTYQQLDYWANNFNDFAASIVVLWDIMVVNNWHVFLDVYSSVTSRWCYIYFIAWWLLSVIIILNLFTALILENFIMKWDRFHMLSLEHHERRDSESAFHLLSLHDMFRESLQEPTDTEILVEISHHQYLDLS